MTRLRTTLAAGLLGLFVAGMLPAGAASIAQRYVLQTRQVNIHEAGEIDGILNMAIVSNGAIQGTYRFAYEGTIRTVTGSLSGDRIILYIGAPPDQERIIGTFRDGVLDAGVDRPSSSAILFRSVNAPTPNHHPTSVW